MNSGIRAHDSHSVASQPVSAVGRLTSTHDPVYEVTMPTLNLIMLLDPTSNVQELKSTEELSELQHRTQLAKPRLRKTAGQNP